MFYSVGVLFRFSLGLLCALGILIIAPVVYAVILLHTALLLVPLAFDFVICALTDDEYRWERRRNRFYRSRFRALCFIPDRCEEIWDWVWANA